MSEIKAIETVYNGYRFRSRLEARWAVFFDAAGIKYEYEPEGFDVNLSVLFLCNYGLKNLEGTACHSEAQSLLVHIRIQHRQHQRILPILLPDGF